MRDNDVVYSLNLFEVDRWVTHLYNKPKTKEYDEELYRHTYLGECVGWEEYIKEEYTRG